MVKAVPGVLISGDVALIEFIRALNEGLAQGEKVIVEGLDDTHLFVKADKVEFVRLKVAEWQQSLRYEPKKDQQ